MLHYPNGDLFSTGVTACEIEPLNREQGDNNRIILMVEVDGALTRAVLDTGGIYCILHPAAADDIQFDTSQSLGPYKINIRGFPYKGSLYRSTLRINAEQGDSLEQDVTVFVPEATAEEWGELPTFLGLTGCLERLRFAVDPSQDKFYFGALP